MTILQAPSVLSNVSLDLSVARTASGGFNHEPHTLTQRRERETDRQTERLKKRERDTHTSKNSLSLAGQPLHTGRKGLVSCLYCACSGGYVIVVRCYVTYHEYNLHFKWLWLHVSARGHVCYEPRPTWKQQLYLCSYALFWLWM